MKSQPTILVLDFGSQYTQLIARRVRETHVYSEIVDSAVPVEELLRHNPAGLILSGGPASVHEEGAPTVDPRIFELGIPVLGVCYGLQLMTQMLGGRVQRSGSREYGSAEIEADVASPFFKGVPARSQVWMSHADEVVELAPGFTAIARSGRVPRATSTACSSTRRSSTRSTASAWSATSSAASAAARAAGHRAPTSNRRSRISVPAWAATT
jgi:GMP synthase (glutamine-hydrolysing)